MKKILIFLAIILLVLLIGIVIAIGITGIFPNSIELMPSQCARFTFSLQSSLDEGNFSCTYSINETFPLLVKWDKNVTMLWENYLFPYVSEAYVYGTVKVPIGVAYGNYLGKVRAYCVPIPSGQITFNMGAPGGVNVTVVEERTRNNSYVYPNQNETDTDNDTIGDFCDNCPFIVNLDQTDSDRDGDGNVCDPCTEFATGFNYLVKDNITSYNGTSLNLIYDTCNDDMAVKEYYCQDNQIKTQNFPCQKVRYEYRCTDGACKIPSVIPPPTPEPVEV